jgi:NADPH:quinone reductase-like Zn-dependent oxidoreductase
MKAILIEEFGSPETLVEREISAPELGPTDIKVRVHASGVNFADLLQRLNLYGNAPPIPYTPGFEIAGVVKKCGEAVSKLQKGDRIVGLTRFGGYAEEVCLPESAAVLLPESFPFPDAAAIPVNYLTAWFCLFELGRLKAQERVLIQTGCGGVGLAAVQLARWKEAQIIATAGSEEKVLRLKDFGVELAINYREQPFQRHVLEAFGRKSVDLVLDSVGGRVLQQGYELLAPLGRLVSYGLSSAVSGKRRNRLRALKAVWQTPSFKPLDLIQQNRGVFGFHLGLLEGREQIVQRAFQEIMRLFLERRLEAVIAKEFPLSGSGAAAAHTYLHERKNIGKVILCNE